MSITNPLILYDNRLEDATPVATDTESGYDVKNLIDLRPYTFWKAASSGTKYITVDCGSNKSADALGIVGHNLKTAAATISVEYSSDNFSGDINVALAGFQPSDDNALLKEFTTQSAQYWRLKIVTASVKAQIGVVLMGEVVEFERMQSFAFAPFPERIIAESSKSKQGHFLGSVIRHIEAIIEIKWKIVTVDWISNTFRDAWDGHLSLLKPFFWAWDISDHSSEIYFVRIPDDFELKMPFVKENINYRSMDLVFQGVKE